MEVRRLVVEAAEPTVSHELTIAASDLTIAPEPATRPAATARPAPALDFDPGLTIAYHEQPGCRQRWLADLLAALGPGRSGVHLELVDHQDRSLAVFRPHGGRHRVIDIDRRADVTGEYRAANGAVDPLGRAGLDVTAAARLLRVDAAELERRIDTGTDNARDARRLASVDQAVLWPAARRVLDADAALATAQAGVGDRTVEDAVAFDDVAAVHAATAATIRSHRPIQRLGVLLAVLCLGLGTLLLSVDRVIGDNHFTGAVLLGLGVLAVAVTGYDRRSIHRARRREQAALAPFGVDRFGQLVSQAGPLADDDRRAALLETTDASRLARLAWEELSGGTAVTWALQHRDAITMLAVQRAKLGRVGVDHLAADDSPTADVARLLVDRVIELQQVGATRERLPLLLDEPFAGFPPGEVSRLLATLVRLGQHHQVVLVTGDPYIQAWATEHEASEQQAAERQATEHEPAGWAFVRLIDPDEAPLTGDDPAPSEPSAGDQEPGHGADHAHRPNAGNGDHVGRGDHGEQGSDPIGADAADATDGPIGRSAGLPATSAGTPRR